MMPRGAPSQPQVVDIRREFAKRLLEFDACADAQASQAGKPTMGRTYDHRIKQLIAASGDLNLFPDLSIPRSTARHWIRFDIASVVALPGDEEDDVDQRLKIAALEQRLAAVDALPT